jgi:hypothetical protein
MRKQADDYCVNSFSVDAGLGAADAMLNPRVAEVTALSLNMGTNHATATFAAE